MQRHDHPLLSASLGSQKSLSSFHFGPQQGGRKVYIQASLHAEELPGMLVAHHLRQLLQDAEDRGAMKGNVVLVPVANPIGLTQRLNHKPSGRFELDSAENFNRNYPDLAAALLPQLMPSLGPDPVRNVALVRAAMASYLQAWQPATELQSLRKTLLLLNHDADVVLDLHCDTQSVLHFYCEEACWPSLEPLTRYLQCEVVLLAHESGGGPMDERLSGVWWKLAQALRQAGYCADLPQACLSCTVELRGEADVSHALAQQDALAIFHYLQHIGMIACEAPPVLPAGRCAATPLAGSQTLHAPTPGVVVFAAEPGQQVTEGQLIAEIIDPISGTSTAVRSGVSGKLYARIRERYVTTGCELCKVAGSHAFRSGSLLGD